MYEQVATSLPFPPVGYGTSLPTSPNDGDLFCLVDSAAAPTYQWMLRYVAAKSTNKWVFVGGTPLYSEVSTSESTTSTSYAALSTAGPSVTLPVAGDYHVTQEAQYLNTTNADGIMSYDIGGTGAVDADSWKSQWANSGNGSMNTRTKFKAGLTAVALVSKYKTDTGTATFEKRRISVLPVAVGG